MYKCFCCDKVLETECHIDSNPMVLSPLYDGVWFRAPGNFGSTVFDPIPDKLRGEDPFLQILICDDCLKKKSDEVSYVHNIRHKVTADVETFNHRIG